MDIDYSLYIDKMEQCLGKYPVFLIGFTLFMLMIFLYHLKKKNKGAVIISVIAYLAVMIWGLISINNLTKDIKNKSIIVSHGPIMHNTTEENIFFDNISFIPENSREGIALDFSMWLIYVDCPYGTYPAEVIYAENSKILLEVNQG